jgi:hypothetical protein
VKLLKKDACYIYELIDIKVASTFGSHLGPIRAIGWPETGPESGRQTAR